MTPLCPLVLSLLAGRPRRAHEVAGALGGDHRGARTALTRLEAAGLARRRARTSEYLLTARGRRELRLQRLLWTRIALM